MRSRALAVLVLAAALPGCSSLGGLGAVLGVGSDTGSSVSTTIEPGDAPVLAASITDLVARRVSHSAGPIRLDAADGDGLLGPELARSLEGAGYRLADAGRGYRISYRVASLNEGILVRVGLNGAQAARVYARGREGVLTPRGPFSLRETAQ